MAFDGRPIGGAEVSAATAPPPSGAYLTPRTVSDPAGKFVLTNLGAGAYRISVAVSGYARQEYGAAVSGLRGVNMGTVINLAAGSVVRGITVRLTGNGVISGRITGPDGAPLLGMEVGALLKTFDETGNAVFRPDGSFATTDDRGEYRVAGLTPGRYYMRASVPPLGYDKAMGLISRLRGGAPPAGPSPGRFAATYFPGVSEVGKAFPLDLTAGSDLRNVNFILPRPQLYRIRGRVTAPTLGRPIDQPLSFIVQPTKAELFALPDIVMSPVGSDGAFELADIAPGEYWVTAVYPSTSRARGYALARIAAADAEGLEITLLSEVTIAGSLRVEGVDRNSGGWGSTKVELRGNFVPGLTGPPLGARIAPDGTLTFPNMAAMEYRLAVSNRPPDLYVKEARFGDSDALTDAIQINRTPLPRLDIVLARGVEVAGVVADMDGSPVQDQTVVLVPEGAADRPDRYRQATTDSRGRFTVPGIAPGDYTAYAWQTLEPFHYFDSDFVSAFAAWGTPLRVGEGLPGRSIDVRLITSDAAVAPR